ncbi:uncharacterized protein [Nicotiana sylvestris]|uniref:uncharacterized protein n=1 Tax=Nicotiana sylvestris TaxID=4096 RepID=UPI00388CB25B
MAFEKGGDEGTLRYRGKLCVPDVDGLIERIMSEAHNYRYSIHLGFPKMYHDLKEIYWWNDMKKKVADFVAKCLNCQQVKVEQQKIKCRLPISWFEVGEAELLGPDLANQSMEKVKLIQGHLKTAQSRQKSYSNMQHRDLEVQVDDWVFLNISPEKGVIRFGKKGKLNPRYNGPYRIL